MKKIIVTLLIMSMIINTSCDFNLEEHPHNAGGDMVDYPAGAAQMVTSIYNVFWSTELMKKSYMETIDMDHDHAAAPTWVVSGAGEGNMTTHWSYNTPADPFNAFYRLINRANYAIENLPLVKDLSEDLLNQYMGEAKFLRAYGYFHLVRMYGSVPLRLAFITPLDLPRASVMSVYEQIMKDLVDASEVLPWKTQGENWGRANRIGSKLLLARVYSTIASAALAGNADMEVDVKGLVRTFTTDSVAGFDGVDAALYYSKVSDLCDEVIATKGTYYDLRSSFKEIWGGANVRNNEFVWGIAGNAQLEYTTMHLGYYYSAIPYNGRGWAGMSEHAFSLYGEGDERGEHGIFHYIKQSFTATSAYVRIPDDATKYPTGPDGIASRAVADYYNIIYPTKWYLGDVVNPQPVTADPGYAYQAQDVIMIRFVEAYLLRAEARNELDDPAGALDDLDVVRKRAKAGPFERYTTNKTTIRSLVLEERAMEFVQEFNRKFDLLRWGLYLKVMNAVGSVRVQGTGMTITKTREPRSLLYAVPLNEINIIGIGG
ncbi:MAG: RagB/SusD family nutrient uptake outer membrane protein [Bacteroidia bacterium]|nr:RagB/SusD family nutrient uptake outer membrane protein [Bacteroidia bacterium]